MNTLEQRIKKFWTNEHKSFHYSFDEIEDVLIPNTSTHKPINMRPLIRMYHWIRTHKFLFILLAFIVIPIVLYVCLIILSNNSAFIPIEFQENSHRLLLVVAHPDDECLFFAPTLRVLGKHYHINLSLVVFSRGNHVGLGEIRARELLGSCLMLNIPKDRCIALDLPKIQDNPNLWWSEQELIPIINEYINKWSIDTLVSFDKGGISGHINHRSVGYAVRLLTQNKNNTLIKMAYELKSVSLLRKYSSLLDFYWISISILPRLLKSLVAYLVPFHLISSPDKSLMFLINTPNDYMASRTAFASHQTQYSWDRYLYLILSRYMFINELKYIAKYM